MSKDQEWPNQSSRMFILCHKVEIFLIEVTGKNKSTTPGWREGRLYLFEKLSYMIKDREKRKVTKNWVEVPENRVVKWF